MSSILPYEKIYLCTLKTREEMEKEIPATLLGWWHDCLPGRTVELRQPTVDDMKRSWVRFSAPKTPEHYMIETDARGCLILKKAIKRFEVKHAL